MIYILQLIIEDRNLLVNTASVLTNLFIINRNIELTMIKINHHSYFR